MRWHRTVLEGSGVGQNRGLSNYVLRTLELPWWGRCQGSPSPMISGKPAPRRESFDCVRTPALLLCSLASFMPLWAFLSLSRMGITIVPTHGVAVRRTRQCPAHNIHQIHWALLSSFTIMWYITRVLQRHITIEYIQG